jgi:hypothetical protein
MGKQLATNAVPRLDVFMLHRSGALTNGAISRWQWPLPTLTITVTARAKGHRLFLSLNDGPEVAYGVVLRPGTTGNTYPFLECTCERSARYLYIHENRIACRQCHELVYVSRMPPRHNNTTARRFARAKAHVARLEEALLLGLKGLKSVPRATL